MGHAATRFSTKLNRLQLLPQKGFKGNSWKLYKVRFLNYYYVINKD